MIAYKQFEILENIKSFYEDLCINSDQEVSEIDITEVSPLIVYPCSLDKYTADSLDQSITEFEVIQVLRK